jgi:hypothetical protein
MTAKRDPVANLHRGHAAKSPESRARSLAGLTAGNLRHGANSASATAPAAARERRRLRKRHPAAAQTTEGQDLIMVMGLRSSVIGRYVTFLDANPGRRPDGHAARELRLSLAAQERALRRLAELERQATTEDPGAALRAVMSEYANAELGEATVIDGDDQR